ncbi:MAG: hypothetical protein JWN79_3196 [Gemmatimonadetes bacterium]|nr:hypothetical protein [Gemmatimonadota bacterium]
MLMTAWWEACFSLIHAEMNDESNEITAVDITDAHLGDTAERRKRRYVANLAFGAIKAQHAAHRTRLERWVDGLNEIASSTAFLVAHGVGFALWLLWNTGRLGLTPIDPYPFGLMTTIVSLEAIFLSIFVLMSQQRESAIAELREELGLQVSLRVEQEVTKTLQLVAGLYTRLGHRVSDDPELLHMLQPLDVRAIERDLLAQIESATRNRKHNTMLDGSTPASPMESIRPRGAGVTPSS